MEFTGNKLFLILAMASTMATITVSKDIIVGGSENWHLGFNYTQWAAQNSASISLNDNLVFIYDSHSVFTLPDQASFDSCDISAGKMIADTTQGGGAGFKFQLTQKKIQFFACGIGQGFHCKAGMKFSVTPK